VRPDPLADASRLRDLAHDAGRRVPGHPITVDTREQRPFGSFADGGVQRSGRAGSKALEQAVHGAAQKLARLLDSTLGRLHDHREKTSGLPLSGTESADR